MTKANLKRNASYYAFILFLISKNRRFTISGIYNLMHDDYINITSIDTLNKDQHKQAREVLKRLEEAIEAFNLPYRIDRIKTNNGTIYYHLVKTKINNTFDFIQKDNIESIRQLPAFYLYCKLVRKQFITLELLQNLFNTSRAATFSFLNRFDTTLGELTNFKLDGTYTKQIKLAKI